MVYEALSEAGFDATYYRLRDLASSDRKVRPAPVDSVQLAELDTEDFLKGHTRTVADGVQQADLFLDGVHCAACVWLVERMPFVVDGVESARLDLPRARVTLRWRPGAVNLSEVATWLARFGYALQPSRPSGRATDAERRLLIRLGVSWALAGNVMLIAFALYAGLDLAGDVRMANAARWMSMALALPSVLYGGYPFYSRAWAALRLAVRTRRFDRLHMDTPIAAGILAGFGHSVWATVSGSGEIWFDSITILIAALLTARWVQLRSRRFAGDASDRLLSLIPSMVRRVTESGAVEVVRAAGLLPGEIVEVPAGDVFPVDGVVVSGSSAVNNAVLTGESRPEKIAPGSRVEAGATNVASPVQLRVTASGDETRVGRLLSWVRDQEGRRAPVVLLADRLGGYFVLTVLLLSAFTALLWWDSPQAVQHVVALLVITCPCALGMATPLAMSIAAGRAARSGIFIKSDEVTQRLTDVDCIVLDKTGTLTEGRMSVVAYEGNEEALDMAAALEKLSSHPIGTAIVMSRSQDFPTPDAFQSIPGSGVRGWIADHDVAVGRLEWIESLGKTCPDRYRHALTLYCNNGYTPVAVALDNEVVGALAVGDRIRISSKTILEEMIASGKSVHVLSGDHSSVVNAVARQLGIHGANVVGSAGPERKAAYIQKLQRSGCVVAMVGDGVNDAAALQTADVGIAVHGGSTASMVAADVFLTRGGLEPLRELFSGGRRVMRVIRRNLGLSLLYNVAGATAAILGLVTPLVAAVAMPLSSLAVVASSIAQRSFTPKA